jgi:hypothetical protein
LIGVVEICSKLFTLVQIVAGCVEVTRVLSGVSVFAGFTLVTTVNSPEELVVVLVVPAEDIGNRFIDVCDDRTEVFSTAIVETAGEVCMFGAHGAVVFPSLAEVRTVEVTIAATIIETMTSAIVVNIYVFF